MKEENSNETHEMLKLFSIRVSSDDVIPHTTYCMKFANAK